MKTICIFDKDGKLINIGDWDYKYETDRETGEQIVNNPLPDGAYSEEKEVLVDKDGGLYVTKNPIAEGEKWVSKYFTTIQLLQMKVWMDAIPASETPKLKATYDWISTVSLSAIKGQTEFQEPTYSFEDVANEALRFFATFDNI
jgi:hypothetical protein